ncbi:MAG: hypothetical protein LBG92_09770 [Prevotellaceae bacterium]|nr:hypothetical protein [Prevotellaceae bacterium]
MKKIFIAAFTLTVMFCVHSHAQHGTSSPYSLTGLGELDNKTYGLSSGMAGTGVGSYIPGILNISNPAAIAIDSLSFLFDVSLSGNFSQYSTVARNEYATNANVRKVAFGARILPKLSVAMGMLPYSNVQYRIQTDAYVEGSNEKYDIYYTGTGGLSRMFLTGSYKILKNWNIGANFSYIFGRINRTEAISSHSVKTSSDVNKLLADFGLMYHKNINTSTLISAGLTYAYQTEIKMKNFTSYSMTGKTETNTSSYTSLPQALGGGFSLQHIKGHSFRTLSIDYKFNNWGSIKSPDSKMKYTDSHKVSIGGSMIPNYRTPRNYFQKIQYQLGAYYEKTNMIINGNALHEAGITAGMVFSLKNNYTQLFLSGDFGRKSGNNLISENFVRITFGVTMNQQWFMKWFYD